MLKRLSGLMFTLVFLISFMGEPGYAVKSSFPVIGYIGDEYQAHVTVNDNKVITINSNETGIDSLEKTKQIAQILNKLLYEQKLRADQILPGIRNNNYIARIGNEIIFTVDKKLAKASETNPSALTMKWVNDLRYAFGGYPVNYQVSRGISRYSGKSIYGYASWYGGRFQGRFTSSGETYNMFDFTAAHRTIPLGTPVLVTNLNNGRSVLVKINDRGPFSDPRKRIIDLSRGAFRAIAPLNSGVVRIKLDIMR